MTSLIGPNAKIKVSSVLNRDNASFGKQNLTDGNHETCWNSEQGLPQYILIDFGQAVEPRQLDLMFQGGFVGKKCVLLTSAGDNNYKPWTTIYPDDVNSAQRFPLDPAISQDKDDIVRMKLLFEESSDFFGRITVAPQVGDRVQVQSAENAIGTLRFLGTTDFKTGIWAGVELDVEGTGKNDGSVNGVYYFHCAPKTGLFALASKIVVIEEEEKPTASTLKSTNSRAVKTSSLSSKQSSPQAHKAAMAAARISAGSRASRYLGMKADDLSRASATTTSPTPDGLRSVSGQRIRPPSSLSVSSSTGSHKARNSLNMKSPTSAYSARSSYDALHPRPASSTRDAMATLAAAARELEQEERKQQKRLENGANDDGHLASDFAEQPNDNLSDILDDMPDDYLSNLDYFADGQSLIMDNDSITSEEGYFGGSLRREKELADKLQHAQMRLEVLEAENRLLRLDNEQNCGTGDEQAKNQSASSREPDLSSAWAAERERLQQDKAELEDQLRVSRARLSEIEQKLVVTQSELTSAKQSVMSPMSPIERSLTRQSSFSDEDFELAHEKVQNLTDTIRAKDMFLSTLTEQLENLRTLLEDREREVRRAKADIEKERKLNATIRTELTEMEEQLDKIMAGGNEETQRLREELHLTQERADREKREIMNELDKSIDERTELERRWRERCTELEEAVDELKKAGMDSIDLYETTVAMHRTDMEAVQNGLNQERAKAAALQNEVNELRKDAEDAIEAYEATIKEIEQAASDREEEKNKEISQLQKELASVQAQIQEFVNKPEHDQDEEMAKLRSIWDSEKARLNEKVSSLSKELEDKQSAHINTLSQLKKATDELAGFQRNNVHVEQLRATNEELQGTCQSLQSQLETKSNELTEQREQIVSLKQEIQLLTDGSAALQRKIELRDKELQTQTDKMQHLQKKLEHAEADHVSLSNQIAEISSKQGDKHRDTTELELLNAELDLQKKQKAEALLKCSQLQEQLQGAMSKIEVKTGNSQKVKDLTARLERYEERLAATRHNISNLEHQLADKAKEVESLTEENAKLHESHRQIENECMKLMDEVEKLHSEGLGLKLDETPTESKATGQLVQTTTDSAKLKTQLDRLQMQHAFEIRELQSKISELERTKQRDVDLLNKDIAELESLIESKIFHEADLEESLEKERKTVERLREEMQELRRQQAISSLVDEPRRQNHSSTLSKSSSTQPASNAPAKPSYEPDLDAEELYCELCEQPGHDIISCTASYGDLVGKRMQNGHKPESDNRTYCEYCEEYDTHDTAHCPHGDETF
ncbi:hypothetical protein BZG36_04968 [Bifiguratus adelaidae]|uniref:CAP-Gly domain-containing protein n=1 Tax=Bifiguratus adelaidae TaxID=1938954 RepID=A0A261XUZ8_9FUNG|nr:hypothetical protein BZG36_04968 [Bifiguratus adelaidae]